MKPRPFTRIALFSVLALAGHDLIQAHEGEDHGQGKAPIAQSLMPRAEAASADFELLAVLEADRLLVYLDRYASNEPVTKASVEVEGAGLDAKATETGPGVYAVALPRPLPSGSHAFTFTLQAGDAADLLSAKLELAPLPAAAATAAAPRWWPWAAGAGALAAAGFGAAAWRRRAAANPRTPS
jgi:hypothetical protein